MKKMLKEYDVKFIGTDAVNREDYNQLIGHADDFDLLTISHGPSATALVEVDEVLFENLIQRNEDTGNFEFNIDGLDLFIQVAGADNVFLTQKGDVYDVSSKGLPVPPVINDVIPTDSTKI